MIAAIFLALLLGWIAVAVVAGTLLYARTQKRWLQVAATLVILWLPFWDVIPGLILYRGMVLERAGVNIYSHVRVPGYLDASSPNCQTCWSTLFTSNFRYKYLEVYIGRRERWLPTLTPQPGYYEFRKLPRDSAECLPFERLPNVNRLRDQFKIGDYCVSATHRNAPISRYAYITSQGWVPIPTNLGISGLEIRWQEIRNIRTDELLAEARAVRFRSFLGRWVGFPIWEHTHEKTDGRIELHLEEVLIPNS